MEEEKNQEEKVFTLVMSKSDVEMVLTGLGELPSKYSHTLINKIEMLLVAQSKNEEHDNT